MDMPSDRGSTPRSSTTCTKEGTRRRWEDALVPTQSPLNGVRICSRKKNADSSVFFFCVQCKIVLHY